MHIPTTAPILLITLFVLTSCVSSTNQKSLVIPPSDKPVTVTSTAEYRCYKYPWLHCYSHQKLEASNGQIVEDTPD